MTAVDMSEVVRASRMAQGLPPTITDPVALRVIADLIADLIAEDGTGGERDVAA